MAHRRNAALTLTNDAASHPVFELRVKGLGGGELELSIWQLPSPATPRLKEPERTASLWGRSLRLVENRVFKRLKSHGIRLRDLRKDETQRVTLDEDAALNLALMFRALAPMRSIDRIRSVAEGIDNLTREEAGYWLGMAVHRSHPRRVLAALRLLLTMPQLTSYFGEIAVKLTNSLANGQTCVNIMLGFSLWRLQPKLTDCRSK